jgi:hypothetical protein
MRRLTVIFILCLAFLSSCSPAKHLNIEKIGLAEFRMESSTKANAVFNVTVENTAQYPVQLIFMDATIKKDMELFATISLKDTAVVASFSKETVKVPFEITLCDPMSLLSMGLNVRNWNIDDFMVNGKVTLAGNKGAKSSRKIKDMPLGTLVKHLEK